MLAAYSSLVAIGLDGPVMFLRLWILSGELKPHALLKISKHNTS